MTDTGCYFVLAPDDVIAHVSEPLQGTMGAFVGHSLWERMPKSEPVFRPHFEDARRTGCEVEFVAYYAGGTVQMTVVPSGESLTVYPTRLSTLDVRTLATLRASLERIASELGARAPGQPGRPAPASLQALP